MTDNQNNKIQKRLNEIEERKMEILTETAKTNEKYSVRISKLNSEYSQLDEEYFGLQLQMLKKKQKR
jgi:hypothetical protein